MFARYVRQRCGSDTFCLGITDDIVSNKILSRRRHLMSDHDDVCRLRRLVERWHWRRREIDIVMYLIARRRNYSPFINGWLSWNYDGDRGDDVCV